MHKRSGFTLIEVMVAVMIVSVVIAAIYKMQGDTHHIFFKLKEKSQNNQYLSFIIWNNKYGFEDDKVNLERLAEEFKIEDDLRRKFKNIKLEITYDKLQTIDMAEYEGSSNVIFELGMSRLKKDDFSDSLYRLRLQ